MQNRSLPSSFVLAMMLVLPLSGFTAYQDKLAQGAAGNGTTGLHRMGESC